MVGKGSLITVMIVKKIKSLFLMVETKRALYGGTIVFQPHRIIPQTDTNHHLKIKGVVICLFKYVKY